MQSPMSTMTRTAAVPDHKIFHRITVEEYEGMIAAGIYRSEIGST